MTCMEVYAPSHPLHSVWIVALVLLAVLPRDAPEGDDTRTFVEEVRAPSDVYMGHLGGLDALLKLYVFRISRKKSNENCTAHWLASTRSELISTQDEPLGRRESEQSLRIPTVHTVQ